MEYIAYIDVLYEYLEQESFWQQKSPDMLKLWWFQNENAFHVFSLQTVLSSCWTMSGKHIRFKRLNAKRECDKQIKKRKQEVIAKVNAQRKPKKQRVSNL